MERDQLDRDAQLLSLRFAVEALWTTILASQVDPLRETDRVAEQSLRELERFYERAPNAGERAHLLVQSMLSHHESLWESIRSQVATAVGETPE